MKRFLFTLLFISAFLISAAAHTQNIKPGSYPHTILTNGEVSCSVFLPDRANGFYRTTRWEWSGMIWKLTYKGHTFFEERRSCQPHNPLDNEHGMSTAEEFDILKPVRFDEARPGETFMKIGVGLLEKPADTAPYRFNGKYRMVEPGTWSTDYGETWVEFKHTLHDKYGYGYTYRKRMELLPGEPVLLISNSLENTGTRRIQTEQYNHNFFAIDDTPIGPDYRIDMFFTPTLSADFSPAAGLDGNALVFFHDVEKSLFTNIFGFDATTDHNHVIIRNTATGAGVDIRGNYPISKYNFWTDGQTICPELFVLVNIAPGESYSWSRKYTFIAE